MYKKFLMIVAALGLLGLTTGQASANTVSFVEGTSILTGGVSPITLTLQGDFSATPVDGGDMIMSWNSSVLDLVSAAPVVGWSLVTDPIVPGSGSLGFTSTWDGAGQNSGVNQQFASFTFNVVGAPGTFSDVATISDTLFGGWAGAGVSNLPTTYIDISVGVSAVPVPAAAWLMLSGLVGLVGIGRSRRV
jgi:hypothetical protein